MKSSAKVRNIATLIGASIAAACVPVANPPAPATVATPSSTFAGSTIDVDVRQNDRLALFLFAYHAARQLSERELSERIALTDEDAAALSEHSAAFAPLAEAFAPYLDQHPLRSRDMLYMSGNLAGAEVDFPDAAMLAALTAFEPVYLEHFAPRHRESTGSMAIELERQLATHGEAMALAVSTAVEGHWRQDDPIRIDLVPYVSRAGAYTISFHTVMSSLREDYRNHALEMVFHEAAHTSPMTDRIKQVANEALERHGIQNRRFWHYLQFYAIGRAAQSVLGEDYVPYHVANGLDQRRSARPYYAAIEAVWDDYDTLSERADAAIALIASQQPG